MSVSKIRFDGNTLIDLTSDTVTAADLTQGVTAHDASGNIITGTRVNNCKCYSLTLSADVSSNQVILNGNGDADIAAHRNDNSFVVGMFALFGVSNSSTRSVFVSNNVLHSTASDIVYGVWQRSSSNGLSGQHVVNPANSAPESKPGTMSVDSGGVIRAFGSSAYPLRAGNYLVICGW